MRNKPGSSLVSRLLFQCRRRELFVSIPSRKQASLMSTWSFPRPDAPPSDDEVASQGLPLLQKVVQHAHADRPFLSEWPSSASSASTASVAADDSTSSSSSSGGGGEDHRVLSYQEVIAKAIQVSTYIQQKQATSTSTSSSSSSPFIAHSTIPGSDYIACQWGAFATQKASVPLSITQKTPELEHVLQDSNPLLILVSPKAPNHAQVLQAAHNLNMSDRVVHLEDEILSSLLLLDTNDGGGGGDLPDAAQLLEGSTSISSSAATSKNPTSLDQPALLLYTSGTTGKPKGVLHSHRNLYHQITDLAAAWEWQPEDVALHVLPLHHVHGVVNGLSCAAYAGAQLQFQPFDPYQLWKQWANQPSPHAPGIWKHHHNRSNHCYYDDSISSDDDDDDRHSLQQPQKSQSQTDPTVPQLPRPTVFMAVPTIYAKLLEAARNSPPDLIAQAVERTLYPMRLQVSGSAALPTTILEEWQQLTRHTLLERYGMTEFAMALSNPYNEIVAPRRAGHVGVALPSAQVRLVDETTKEVVWDGKRKMKRSSSTVIDEDEENYSSDAPISGALQVKGPIVFQEYWNRPEATQEAFTEDGYFDTGDVAEYNPALESYRILGRASVDILKVGGHKLSALEIERTLLEHAQLEEVVIVGIPDETWGQRVGMIARSATTTTTAATTDFSLGDQDDGNGDPPLALEELQEWCESRMAKYKTPTRIVWLDEIPKNSMGKVNKKELVALFHEDC